MSAIVVRPLQADDCLQQLTELIHAAYAPHAAQGMRYWGTHQTLEDTAQRLAGGQGLIAEVAGQLAGTLTLRPPQPQSPVPLYRQQDTWSLSQFAVAPMFKGLGVGQALHQRARELAAALGGRQMALDTAAPALPLIELYGRWGYVRCGEWDWRPHTNYLSVLMILAL